MHSRRFLGLIAIACLAACTGVPAPDEAGARFELFVLGNMQDGGLPQLGCAKACCAEARRTGRSLHPTSLGIHDHSTDRLVLVEATPAIEAQVSKLHELAGVSRGGKPPVDAILLTQAHIGHYAGLVELGREVANTKELPVFVSPRMAEFLEGNAPWSQLVRLRQIVLHKFEFEVPFEPVPGLWVEAIRVPNAGGDSDTAAFKIRNKKTILFLPEIDQWNRQPGIEFKLLHEVDLAYIDGTFYDGRELPDRDLGKIPHPPMQTTMKKLAPVARTRPGVLRFIHMNHDNPVLRDDGLRRDLEARGYRIAEQNERERF